MITNMDQFESVFDAITNNIVTNTEKIINMESVFGEKTYNQIASLNGTMQDVNKNLLSMLEFDREQARDQARRREQEKVTEKSAPIEPETPQSIPAAAPEEKAEGFFSDLFGSLSGIPFSQLITAAFIAPFVYKFVEGFIEEITDGVVDVTVAGITGISSMIQGKYFTAVNTMLKPFTSILSTVAKLGDDLMKSVRGIALAVTMNTSNFLNKMKTFSSTFTKVTATVGKIVNGAKSIFTSLGSFGSMLGKVGSFVSKVFSALPGAGTLKLLLGKLAWPITIVMGLVEAVRDYIETDGPRFEKFKAAVGGFFGEVVGAPLDLLKNISAWVLGKFGFDEQSEALQNFSFTDQIKKIVGGAFDVVKGVVNWVKDLFVDPKEALKTLWKTALGTYESFLDIIFYPIDKAVSWVKDLFVDPKEALNTLWKTALGTYESFLDIIFYPIDKAVSWVSGMFGWEPGEDFSMSKLVLGAFDSAVTWVKGKFTWNDETAPKMSIVETVTSWVEDLKLWVKGLFPELPTSDEISKAFFDSLPAWMQKAINAVSGNEPVQDREQILSNIDQLNAERSVIQDAISQLNSRGDRNKITKLENQLRDIDSQMDSYRNMLSDMDSYSTGTRGFVDFGKGTLAMLHDQEAVVPRGTPAGSFLDSLFDENWNPKLSQMTADAVGMPISAVAPVPMMKQKYVADSAEQRAIESTNAQRAIMSIAPNMMTNRPVTNNNSNTTIINNISPARSLDDPSMLK